MGDRRSGRPSREGGWKTDSLERHLFRSRIVGLRRGGLGRGLGAVAVRAVRLVEELDLVTGHDHLIFGQWHEFEWYFDFHE